MSAIFVHQAISVAQDRFTQQSCILAAIALLLYETCQTADLELEYIWARGRARMILLFVTIRHVQLANLIMVVVSYAYGSPDTCQALTIIDGVLLLIPYLSWAVFSAWRAYALSSSNVYIGLFIFICGVTFFSPNLLQLVGTTSIYSAMQPSPCIGVWKGAILQSAQPYLLYASRPINLLGEVVVLALTCRATHGAWRSSKNSARPASLPDVLYTNGILCFSVATILHAVTTVLTLRPTTQAVASSMVAIFRDVIITILLSRFILEIAKAGSGTSDLEGGTKATGGILTTEWAGDVSGVSSQWSLDDEYNGRGFDKDLNSFEVKEHYDA